MVRSVSLGLILSCVVPVFCAAQSAQDPPASPATAQPVSPAPATEKARKVWTNEDVKSSGPVSVIGDPEHQKYPMTKPPDPALVAKYRASLQKLQTQLDGVNKQLQAYKDFKDGKGVSEGGQDFSQSYSRTPVNQQMTKLLAKKKQLEDDMDALFEESRKKGIESGLLK
jgi:hypothetical protein